MNKRNIYLMYTITFFQGMVFYASVATLYRQLNGISIFQITLIESISFVLSLLFEIPWGIVADKIGYKNTMKICCLLFFISKIIFWQATDFIGFLSERIILSIVISGLSGVDTSILYLSCNKNKSHHVFSIYTTLGELGLLFSSIVFSLFIKDNYKLSAFLTIISYGFAFILSLFICEVKNISKSKKTNSIKNTLYILKSILKNKYLLMFIIGVALINQTYQFISVFLNQLQLAKIGVNSEIIGFMFILMSMTHLVSAFSHNISNLIGCKKLLLLSYIITMIFCIVLSITSNTIISVLSILVISSIFSLFQPLQNNLQNIQVNSSNRATELSIFSIIISSIGISTNLIFGSFAQKDISLSFCCGAVFCLIGFVLVYIWVNKIGHKFLL